MKLDIPLMDNNITKDDLDSLIAFLSQNPAPILTQSSNVAQFEKEWSDWLGVKYSLFVNSGASANLLTIGSIKYLYGNGEIILPPLTLVSDISSVLHYNFKPVFADINWYNLAMKESEVISKINKNTKAVFLTHILGYNGLTQKLLNKLDEMEIPLIEDVCESHGATFNGKKLGSFGLISNFSFYYAHHMSTIEGGMICTNNEDIYQVLRVLRSHGMVRESTSPDFKDKYKNGYPDLNPDFIFAYPAYNVRSTEINAVLGRNQLKRLDKNNEIRTENLKLFLSNLDSKKYKTDFDLEGSVNYAFTLLLNEPNDKLRDNVMKKLKEANVEFRRGMSGGGNQLRQPYLRKILPENEFLKYPNVDHVHFYGFYIGNYPSLLKEKIVDLCELLNSVPSK